MSTPSHPLDHTVCDLSTFCNNKQAAINLFEIPSFTSELQLILDEFIRGGRYSIYESVEDGLFAHAKFHCQRAPTHVSEFFSNALALEKLHVISLECGGEFSHGITHRRERGVVLLERSRVAFETR
jgi:hypothetical protein